MAYNLTPFKPNQPYQDQVDTELKLANANFTALGQAFMNNDPTQPVLRPVYVNSVAPTNPVASMLWYDTTDKALKLYDGNAWKAVSGASEAQFEELNKDVQSIKSSFLDKDPSKPVIRAVYVGSNAPSNPAVGTSWLDTSTSDPVLKVYDGQSWKTALSNTQSVKTALNAEGEAPIYACRAWVNFSGKTSTPTIRASGNVSSVIRNAPGIFTVNFIKALPDANYSVSLSLSSTDDVLSHTLKVIQDNSQLYMDATSVRIGVKRDDAVDKLFYSVAVFR